MLTLNDLIRSAPQGTCFRYYTFNKFKPNYEALVISATRIECEAWGWLDLRPSNNLNSYIETYGLREVELLESYITHPVPTVKPIQDLNVKTGTLIINCKFCDPIRPDLLDEVIDGLTLRSILTAYELALQSENLAIDAITKQRMIYSREHGYLSKAQTEAASRAWSIRLRQLQSEAKSQTHQIVCQEIDEMPNMAPESQ